jgi:hypothetical protein
MSEEAKKALSEKLRAKWASGTRKKNPPETYVKSSASMKKLIAERGQWLKPTREECSRGGKTVTEKQIQVNQRIAKLRRGARNPPGPSEAGVNNWKAKFWVLRTPNRDLISGVNLAEIIRRHKRLFDPADVTDRNCRQWAAYKGLNSLFHLTKNGNVREHWKGWTAIEDANMVKNVKVPIGRQLMVRPARGSGTSGVVYQR